MYQLHLTKVARRIVLRKSASRWPMVESSAHRQDSIVATRMAVGVPNPSEPVADRSALSCGRPQVFRDDAAKQILLLLAIRIVFAAGHQKNISIEPDFVPNSDFFTSPQFNGTVERNFTVLNQAFCLPAGRYAASLKELVQPDRWRRGFGR